MYLKLLNVDYFVQVNKLEQITDPIYLEHGRPTPRGLFSHEIFGITPYDRSTIWGYIDLGEKFLHPLAYINLIRYNKSFESIIAGVKKYRFENGEFIEDPNGDTGIKFLYDNYNNIKWKTSNSIFPQERIKFLKENRDILFISKYPVTPPFYRDINDGSQLGVAEVNDLYKKLISQSIMLTKRSGSFSLFGHITRANIQNTLVDIFKHYIYEEFHGKQGIMRKSVMGVNVDRGSRLVMSAPKIDADTYDQMIVDFYNTGIPLHDACAIGYDFVVKGVKDFFDNEFIRGGKYPYRDSNGNITYITLIEPEIEYSEEYIKKKITEFCKGDSTRFGTIKIPKNKEGLDLKLYITGRFNKNTTTISSRYATWTDILYLVCERVLSNKYVTVTRYPIEDFYCMYHNKIRILSTIQTTEVVIGGETYKWYPVVNPDTDSSNKFINTLVPSNLLLKGMGGDFDGDQVTVRLLYSNEANLDAENYMYDKKNYLNLMGGPIRLTERDFVQCIYSLTKPPKEITLKNLN